MKKNRSLATKEISKDGKRTSLSKIKEEEITEESGTRLQRSAYIKDF